MDLVEIPIVSTASVYREVGDVFAWLCLAGTIAALVAPTLRRRLGR